MPFRPTSHLFADTILSAGLAGLANRKRRYMCASCYLVIVLIRGSKCEACKKKKK